MENCPWCGKSLKPQTIDLKAAIDELEEHLLNEALEKAEGNGVEAAKLLNIPYHSLRFYLKKHKSKEKSHPTKKKSHVSKKGS